MEIKRISWFYCVFFFLRRSSTRKLHKLKSIGQIALSNRSGSELDRGQVEKAITENSAGNQERGPVRGTYITQGGFQGRVELSEIQVVAPSKRMVERLGEVLIEFLVDVPEALFRKDYQLTLFPKLASNDLLYELRPVVLNGNELKSKQQKQYHAYEKYVQSLEENVRQGCEKFLNRRIFSRYLERKALMREKKNGRRFKVYLTHLLSDRRLHERDFPFRDFPDRVPRELTPCLFSGSPSLLPYAQENHKEPLTEVLCMGNGPALERGLSAGDPPHAYNLFWDKRKSEFNVKKIARLDNTFGKIVEYPIHENAYLDTVVNRGRHKTNYLYSLDVGESFPKMLLSLDGAVTAIDGSTHYFKVRDTLAYFVSSMTTFIGHLLRFKRYITLRRIQAGMSVSLLLPAGRTDMIDTLSGNKRELERLRGFYRDLIGSTGLIADSVVILTDSSPEGPWQLNDCPSRERASKAADLPADYFPENMELRQLSRSYSLSENWVLPDTLLEGDALLGHMHRKEIRELIASHADPDERGHVIRQRYPPAYKILKDVYYPGLRSISFQSHLHRAGSARDTVYTDEPGLEYARGIELLENRKYKEALSISQDYADANTILTHMPLRHDTQALIILAAQKSTADMDYMFVVLNLRVGNPDEALRYYQKSCESDPSKVFRGNLDPEIQELKALPNTDDMD